MSSGIFVGTTGYIANRKYLPNRLLMKILKAIIVAILTIIFNLSMLFISWIA